MISSARVRIQQRWRAARSGTGEKTTLAGREARYLVRLLAALLVALGSGCAGSRHAGGDGPVDAAASLTEAATPNVVDATTCSDPCIDGPADATQDSDASDAPDGPEVADAPDETDVAE